MALFQNLNILPISVHLVLIAVLLVNDQYFMTTIFILRGYGFEKQKNKTKKKPPLRLPAQAE